MGSHQGPFGARRVLKWRWKNVLPPSQVEVCQNQSLLTHGSKSQIHLSTAPHPWKLIVLLRATQPEDVKMCQAGAVVLSIAWLACFCWGVQGSELTMNT